MRRQTIEHEFVAEFPEDPVDGVLHVSVQFATALHRCCCGCGNKVITPLSQTDWTLTYDGRTVSLDPSIGNWSFPCQSHYFITRNRVEWPGRWTQKEIASGRAADRARKEGQGSSLGNAPGDAASEAGRYEHSREHGERKTPLRLSHNVSGMNQFRSGRR